MGRNEKYAVAVDDKTLEECRAQWPGFKGITQIWADAVCIYDTSPQRPDESDQEYEARLAWSKGNV